MSLISIIDSQTGMVLCVCAVVAPESIQNGPELY